MKHKYAIIIGTTLILFLFMASLSADDGNIHFNIPLKKVLSEPTPEADIIYEIPVDINFIGISKDRNWINVRFKFSVLYFLQYEYTGWIYVPVGNLLAKEESPNDSANNSPPLVLSED